MTEAEAIAVVTEQFVGAGGFVARLRRGEGLDQGSVRVVYEALGVLASAWAERPCVPKEAVFPMVDIFTAIESSGPLYPDLGTEIQRLAGDMAERVESIFRSPAPWMTEEEAMGLVYAHLTGVPSLALDLHHGREPDEETLEEMQAAFETLRRAWTRREDVPKSIVGPMLNVRELVAGSSSLRSLPRPGLDEIAEQLSQSVKQCLAGP